MTGDEAELLVDVAGPVGRLTLNRPRRLNALTPGMMTGIRQALDRWRSDPDVRLVLLRGAGDRGLCAGADIRSLAAVLASPALALPAGSPGSVGSSGSSAPAVSSVGLVRDVLALEYAMNLDLAHYPTPVVALMDGIVLGGGVGVSTHCAVRVVTERSSVGMPETAIGLCPDVGALHLLSRAPGECGMHAALTGARFGAADALLLGLADAFVPAAELDDLAAALGSGDVPDLPSRAAPAGTLERDRVWIDACYRGDDVPRMIAALRARPEPAARAAADVLGEMSPFALAVTARAVRRAETLDLTGVLAQDLRVCSRLAARPDFAEGVRAKMIDKDNAPRWTPAALDGVDPDEVEGCFAPLR